jgi:peptide chain release factor 1
LEGTEIGSKSGLVTDGGRNTTEEGRHLRASLGESEDIVDEKEHILVLLITEVLGNGKTGKTDTGTGARGLVHLTVHEGGLGAGAINLDDTTVDHFVVEIISLSCALTDTGED